MSSNGLVEMGEYVYCGHVSSEESEVCYLARTRSERKKKLRARGLVFDETQYRKNDPIGTFFCLAGGHHFKANIKEWTDNGKHCPFCTGEKKTSGKIYKTKYADEKTAKMELSKYKNSRLTIDDIRRRLELFKCRFVNEADYIRADNPINIQCTLCGDIMFEKNGINSMFQILYNYRGIHGKQWKPTRPRCKKCRLLIPIRRRFKYPVHSKQLLPIDEVNKRLAKWNIVCLHFENTLSRDSKWRCQKCGFEWCARAKSYVSHASRQSTPCRRCVPDYRNYSGLKKQSKKA